MAKLTIGRMANLYGLHRSTLHEAVAKGRVTASIDGKGVKVIDLSEMIRVYGEPQGQTLHSPTATPDTLPPLHLDALGLLLDELRLLREEVRELRETMHLLEHNPRATSDQPKSTTTLAKNSPATWASLFSAMDE